MTYSDNVTPASTTKLYNLGTSITDADSFLAGTYSGTAFTGTWIGD